MGKYNQKDNIIARWKFLKYEIIEALIFHRIYRFSTDY